MLAKSNNSSVTRITNDLTKQLDPAIAAIARHNISKNTITVSQRNHLKDKLSNSSVNIKL